MDINQYLNSTFYNNPSLTWLLAALTTAAVFIILNLFKKVIVRRAIKFAHKTTTDIDDFVFDLLERTNIFFLLILSVYVGSLVLSLPSNVTQIMNSTVIIALFLQAGIWGNGLISTWIGRYRQRQEDYDAGYLTTMVALSFVGKVILWSIILLLVLDNLGVEITALVAGLGIGGIAVGLAVQNILGDLFASLSIALDKPFVIGDFIIVDELMGTVEHVGLKTTRVRSLHGEQLIFSNSDLLQSRVRNYKRMEERRILFNIGVTYQTPYKKLAAIPAMIQEIIESQEQSRFDRVHFKEFGDSALNIEIVYYVLSADYNVYMDIQQAINLAIFQRFEEANIEFAYPTQTIYLGGEIENVLSRDGSTTESSRN